jgi:hypothetical protein
MSGIRIYARFYWPRGGETASPECYNSYNIPRRQISIR